VEGSLKQKPEDIKPEPAQKKTSTSAGFFYTDEQMAAELNAQQEQGKPINNMPKKQTSVQDLIDDTMQRVVGDAVTTDAQVLQELSKSKIGTPSPSLETSQDKKQSFFYTDDEMEKAEPSSSWVEKAGNKEKAPSHGVGKG
jgi:hypothetical protein